MYIDDPSFYTSSEEDMLLMIQATDLFLQKDYKPCPILANFFHRHAKDLFWDLHVRLLEKKEEKFPIFALFWPRNSKRVNDFRVEFVFFSQYY